MPVKKLHDLLKLQYLFETDRRKIAFQNKQQKKLESTKTVFSYLHDEIGFDCNKKWNLDENRIGLQFENALISAFSMKYARIYWMMLKWEIISYLGRVLSASLPNCPLFWGERCCSWIKNIL